MRQARMLFARVIALIRSIVWTSATTTARTIKRKEKSGPPAPAGEQPCDKLHKRKIFRRKCGPSTKAQRRIRKYQRAKSILVTRNPLRRSVVGACRTLCGQDQEEGHRAQQIRAKSLIRGIFKPAAKNESAETAGR